MKWLVFVLIIVNIALLFLAPNSDKSKADVSRLQINPDVIKQLTALEMAQIRLKAARGEYDVNAPDEPVEGETVPVQSLVSNPVIPTKPDGVAELLDDEDSRDNQKTVQISPPSSSVNALKPDACYVWGQFDQNQVSQLRSELQSASLKFKIVQKSEAQRFWIYLEPFANNNIAQQQADQLKAKGFDALVLRSGEDMNGVSLALFSQRHLADRLIEKLKEQGINPKLKLRGGTSFQLQFELDTNSAKKLEAIARKYPATPLKKRGC